VPSGSPAFLPSDVPGFVTVFETNDQFAFSLARASLEEAGIEFAVITDDPWRGNEFSKAFDIGWFPMVRSSYRIQVAPEDESESRALVEPLVNPNPTGGPESESV
jgi:hypothetical protein